MDLSNISVIKKILEGNKLWAKKHFGQNFLINKGILEKIVETANVRSEDHVIEIGPGLGILTETLCQKAKKVISIEIDYKIISILKDNLKEFKNLEILNQDALKFIPSRHTYKVVANIPYNITSPLINHFLQAKKQPKSLTLLVQKEVAQKICTLEPDMSILSLQIALFAQSKLIKKVSAHSFFPAPKVESAIIHMEVYQKNDSNFTTPETATNILNLAKKAFSQKRKKLSNTLPELKNKLLEIDIDPNRRPETLSVDEWKKLENLLQISYRVF